MSAPTVLPWAGGELSSVDPQDNGCIESTANPGTRYNATVSRCYISCDTLSEGWKSPTWAAATDNWFHCAHFLGAHGTPLKFYNGATLVAQVVQAADAGPWSIQTLQGGVMTAVGTLNLDSPVLNIVDIRIVAGASGSVSGYLAGTNIFTVTGLDHSGFSGITQVQGRGSNGGGDNAWSQLIFDNVAHVGDSLVTQAEDTASPINADWSGAVSGINETVLDDSHSVTSSAAGQVSTYYKNAASLGTYNVVAVCVGARAQRTSGSSTNLQIALRTNGTNYFGPTTALDFGFQAVCASWTQNPFTAAAWDPVTAAAVEVGMKSIA